MLNADLVERSSNASPDQLSNGRQATYDLRRLRRQGIIEYTAASSAATSSPDHWPMRGRAVHQGPRTGPRPGLSQLASHLPADIADIADIAERSPLAQAWRKRDRTFDDYINGQNHRGVNL